MTHFYLTLPSNSSLDTHPENTLTHYVTKLQIPVSLTGTWEVALEEISIPKSWFRIPRAKGTWAIERDSWHELNRNEKGERFVRKCKLPQGGEFANIVDLIDAMNRITHDDINSMELKVYTNLSPSGVRIVKLDPVNIPRFTYDESTRRVRASIPYGYKIRMSETLLAILGFQKNQLINHSFRGVSNVDARFASDMEAGIHHLYVYCDVVESVPVGDTLAPLLRIVETRNPTGGIINEIFNPPRYLPVQKKNFDTIAIDIRTDFGENVPFESGKVVLTLHFRRSASEYFL